MERETDVEDIIAAIEGRLLYNSIVGQAPYLHQYLFGNDWVARVANLIPVLNKLNSSRYIVAFAAKQLKRYESNESNTIPIKDMLDRFKKFKDEEQLIDDSEMLSHASSNMYAHIVFFIPSYFRKILTCFTTDSRQIRRSRHDRHLASRHLLLPLP